MDDLTTYISFNCYKTVVRCFRHNFWIRFSFIVYIYGFHLLQKQTSARDNFFKKQLKANHYPLLFNNMLTSQTPAQNPGLFLDQKLNTQLSIQEKIKKSYPN